MEKEFTIHCKMEERWAGVFLSMLWEMMLDGKIGHSEMLSFYADGDGDFRPIFQTDFPKSIPLNTTKGVDIPQMLNIAIHHPELNQNGEHCPPYDEEKRIKFYDAG